MLNSLEEEIKESDQNLCSGFTRWSFVGFGFVLHSSKAVVDVIPGGRHPKTDEGAVPPSPR